MGGGNSSESEKKLNEANEKLSSFKSKTSTFVEKSLQNVDKRKVLNNTYDSTLNTNHICVRNTFTNDSFKMTRVNCEDGTYIEDLDKKKFPNLNCTDTANGKMYIIDNNKKSLHVHNKHLNNEYDETTNISVYHELKCGGDYSDGSMYNSANRLLAPDSIPTYDNSLVSSIDELGFGNKLPKDKYIVNLPIAANSPNDFIIVDDTPTIPSIFDIGLNTISTFDNFKNKRKHQNSFNDRRENTFYYQ
tara:strand:+ start:460 stop:1197 length:738 start_codon:yes stop_codon:yes gene_type:complete